MLSQSYLQIEKSLEKHLKIQAVGKKWHEDKIEWILFVKPDKK